MLFVTIGFGIGVFSSGSNVIAVSRVPAQIVLRMMRVIPRCSEDDNT